MKLILYNFLRTLWSEINFHMSGIFCFGNGKIWKMGTKFFPAVRLGLAHLDSWEFPFIFNILKMAYRNRWRTASRRK
jgi:hypothetical protein